MQFIHQGTVIYRRGKMVQLEELSYIFDCPLKDKTGEVCEYVMTALNEEGAVAIRDAHVRTCHPDDLVSMRMDDWLKDENVKKWFSKTYDLGPTA